MLVSKPTYQVPPVAVVILGDESVVVPARRRVRPRVEVGVDKHMLQMDGGREAYSFRKSSFVDKGVIVNIRCGGGEGGGL